MRKKRFAALVIGMAMALSSAVTAFADIDTSSWSSNGIYPQDVMNTEYLTPVKFLMDKKILSGYEDGLFHAEKPITRAEFAKMMAIATNNTAELSVMETKDYFNDLAGSTWAKGYINCCVKAGLMNGRGNDTFAPTGDVTYAEAITVMIRSKDASAVNYGTWPNNYIQYAEMYMNSVIADRNIKDWNAPAERGDIAMMLYRILPKN